MTVNNCSERLSALLQSSPGDQELQLHILYRKGQSERSKIAFFEKLTNITGKEEIKEIVQGSGIIVCSTTLDSVRSLAELPEIDWIDLESKAPIEELIDF